jgi:rubredoxin
VSEPDRKWVCVSCFFVYDEALGLPEHGIAPGTRFEDLPDDWICPECGSPKEYFEPQET